MKSLKCLKTQGKDLDSKSLKSLESWGWTWFEELEEFEARWGSGFEEFEEFEEFEDSGGTGLQRSKRLET